MGSHSQRNVPYHSLSSIMERTAVSHIRYTLQKCRAGNISLLQIGALVLLLVMVFVGFYIEGQFVKETDQDPTHIFTYLNLTDYDSDVILSSSG